MALTDAKIRAAKPRAKSYRMADMNSLYLEVSPAGSKLWRLKFRFARAENRLSLGRYPEVSLAEARDQAAGARRLIRDGIDPSLHRKRTKASFVSDQENRFQRIAEEWLSKQSKNWSESHLSKISRRLQLYVFPHIGREPISILTAKMLLETFERIEKKEIFETAHRALNACNRIFDYAVIKGYCEQNPASHLRGALTPVAERHLPAITDPKALGELLRDIAGYAGSGITKAALELAPHLFVRPGELRGARWSEFDFENREWRIPGPRMKMKVEHVVPLSGQVIQMLTELHRFTGHGEFCFPGSRSAARPMSDGTVNGALRRLGYTKHQLTGHGFRTTASTLLNEQGWNKDFVERQLAHREKNHSRDAYNRAEYLGGRHEMMQVWSDYLDMLKNSTSKAEIDSRNHFHRQEDRPSLHKNGAIGSSVSIVNAMSQLAPFKLVVPTQQRADTESANTVFYHPPQLPW